MIRKPSFLVFLLFLFCISGYSQNMKDATWWFGMKGGITYTRPLVTERYSVFESTGEQEYEKDYGKAGKNTGYTFAGTLGFAFSPSFYLVLEPALTSYRYKYSSQFSWTDNQSTYTINTDHVQKINMIDIPLLMQYRLRTASAFSFYAEAGMLASIRTGAKKDVTLEEVQEKDGKEFRLQEFEESFNQRELYDPLTWGLLAGAGVSADVNFFRVSLGAQYCLSLNNIILGEHRFSDMRLSTSLYDVQDDLKLNNLRVFLSVSTPLDYLIHAPGFLINSKKRK